MVEDIKLVFLGGGFSFPLPSVAARKRHIGFLADIWCSSAEVSFLVRPKDQDICIKKQRNLGDMKKQSVLSP